MSSRPGIAPARKVSWLRPELMDWGDMTSRLTLSPGAMTSSNRVVTAELTLTVAPFRSVVITERARLRKRKTTGLAHAGNSRFLPEDRIDDKSAVRARIAGGRRIRAENERAVYGRSRVGIPRIAPVERTRGVQVVETIRLLPGIHPESGPHSRCCWNVRCRSRFDRYAR